MGLPDAAPWNEPISTGTGVGVISRNITTPFADSLGVGAGTEQRLYRDGRVPSGTQHRKWVSTREDTRCEVSRARSQSVENCSNQTRQTVN